MIWSAFGKIEMKQRVLRKEDLLVQNAYPVKAQGQLVLSC
jgi:hypothetical protein